jgi:tetratricopeptide (TPR) repeat protein
MSANLFMSEAKMRRPPPSITVEQTLQQALAFHQAGKLKDAERLYHSIIASQPNHPTANHNLGILAVQLLQPEAGLPFFRKALSANPGQEQYRIAYAKALLDSRKPEDALHILNAGGRLTSPIAETLRKKIDSVLAGGELLELSTEIDRIVVRFHAGYFAEVEKRAEALLIDHPGSGVAWKILGAAQKAQNKNAFAALRKSAELLPNDAEAHYNLGVAEEDAGLLVEAEASYRKALAIQPDFGKAHYNLGLTLNDLGRIDEAVLSYRKALELHTDFAEVYNNLGAALAHLGKLDEAIASYRKGLQLRPDLAEAHNNLGNIFTRLGNNTEAIACYRSALRIRPEFVEAIKNLANTLAEERQDAEAVAMYRQLLKYQPDDPRIHNSIGITLKDVGSYDEIVASFRKALELDPHYAEAHCNLSVALKNVHRKEAEDHCRRALEIAPNLSSAFLHAAQSYSDRGQFKQAENLLRRIIAMEPDSPEAWAKLASLRKMSIEDTEWLETAERIANSKLSASSEVRLRFALGKFYDDTKNFDLAFSNYQRANTLLKSQEVKYDSTEQTKAVDLVKQLCSHKWINAHRPLVNTSNRPIFIVGMPRSGTSLSEQILASHPSVYGAGELDFWNSACRVNPLPTLAREGAELQLAQLGNEYLRVLNTFSADALHVVDKMPSNFMHVGLLRAVYPNCRIIHMQRNPIDTCLSIYFQHFNSTHAYAYDLEHLAHCYREYRRMMAHWREVLPADTMLEIPYEALTQDQQGWTRKMLDFIGLPWDDRCIAFDKKERVVGTVSNWQVRQKITTSSVERWRNYEKHVGPLLGLLTE